MSPKRVAWIAVIAAVLYVGVAGFVLNNFELPEMDSLAWTLVGLAAGAQITAAWFFGLLYKESVEGAGGTLKAFSAFKAALVGAGVARLIPAGGAITPVAMAWTVRDEEPGTTGAAVRTVLLNYAGLLMMTGVGLLLARPRQSAQLFSISLAVLAPFVLFAGLVLMFGSGKLGSLSKYLPKVIRKRLDATVIDNLPGPESQTYIWCRLALEGAALGLVLRAFGIEVNVFQVMAAFGVAQLAGGLPGTPGGLGVTEAGLVFILSAYGFPSRETLAPVIIYRIVSYWLPAALSFFAGGMTFLRSPEAKAVSEAD
ncbi:MAG TPA: flippase-like domain-containing protein [Acidimicrobiia bacterium]|nr:flippase-like domain-containing protein [Acidimicrobiia bacterium]